MLLMLWAQPSTAGTVFKLETALLILLCIKEKAIFALFLQFVLEDIIWFGHYSLVRDLPEFRTDGDDRLTQTIRAQCPGH